MTKSSANLESNCTCNPDQLNKQDDFWYTHIEKYENRVQALQQEAADSQDLINNLETGMRAYLAYNMINLYHRNPGANIAPLVTPNCPLYCNCAKMNKPEPKVFDLDHMSVFSMQNDDTYCMESIKTLATDEKTLLKNIERLRNKEKNMNEARIEVDKLLTYAVRNNKIQIRANLLTKTSERLLKQNVLLKREFKEIQDSLKDKAVTEIKLINDIAAERDKIIDLEQLLQKTGNGDCNVVPRTSTDIDELKTKISTIRERLNEQAALNAQLKSDLESSRITLAQLQTNVTAKRLHEINEIK